MKFCFNCGTKLPQGTKFCPECGQKIPVAAQPVPVQEPVAASVPQPVAAPAPVEVPVPQPVAAPAPVEPPAPQTVVAPAPVEPPVPQPVAAPAPVEVPAPQPVAAPAPVEVPVPQPVAAPAPVEPPAPQTVVAPAPVEPPVPQPVAAPAPQFDEPPVVTGVYGAPVQHNFAPPVQSSADQSTPRTYQIPVAQPAAPAPQKPRRAPVQQPVAPAPQQPAAQTSTPPAPQQPAAAPWPRKASSGNSGNFLGKLGGKRGIVLIAGAVGLILLIVLLVSCFAGGSKADDPNLGVYDGTSCVVMGMELGADGEWIELKSGGKATLNLMGTEYSCKWELDGEDLTVTQAGDKYYGTLTDGVIVLDFGGMVYTYVNSDYSAPSGQDNPGKESAAPSEVGYWTMLRIDSEDPNSAMDEETIAMLKGLGLEMFVELKEDGTGTFMLDDLASITWSKGVITAPDGTQIPYTMKDDQLIAEMDGMTMIFVRGEGSGTGAELPAVGGSIYEEFWGGDWYGWWIVWTGSGEYAALEDSGWDAYAHIDVYDDNTGTITVWDTDCSRNDPIAEVAVSFEMGVTEYGCMKSESGYFYDATLGHADWNVDVGATVVRMFDRMIAIEGTYVDPTNSANEMDYYIILRPWGMDWEDVRYGDTSETIYDDMMPFNYDSWYLPLIEKGVTAVPDSYQDGLNQLK